MVFIAPLGEFIRHTVKYYPISNNKAEYEAVAYLEHAIEMGIELMKIKNDSQLVVI